MTRLIIAVTPARPGTYTATLDGKPLLARASRTPFFAAARALLEAGTDPDTILEMHHAGSDIVSMRMPIRQAARLAVEETRLGPRFIRHDPEALEALKESGRNLADGDLGGDKGIQAHDRETGS